MGPRVFAIENRHLANKSAKALPKRNFHFMAPTHLPKSHLSLQQCKGKVFLSQKAGQKMLKKSCKTLEFV